MKKSVWIALSILLAGSACAGAQKKGSTFGIAPTTPEGAALQTWFAGDEAEATERIAKAKATPEALFVRGEIAHGSGDVERGFEAWVALLTEYPTHPLTRVAASRLHAARDQVVDFETRMQPVLAALDYGSMPPLTLANLSLLQQSVAFRLWQRSDAATPFEADRYGFPAKWLATPVFSPWRLRDFDVAFAPEKQPALASTYLSPHTAVDTAVNYADVEPYWTQGITLYPPFGSSGLHYLETFATVAGDAPRDYWVFANFVGGAKLFVDGELVIERRETDYDTGKRLRKVRLSPGTHRILVKLAYQASYRDWFDLSFLPVDGPLDDSKLTFAYGCLPDRALPGCHDGGPTAGASVALTGKLVRPSDVEQIFVDPTDVARASDAALWVTMVASHFDSQDPWFRAASLELEKRHPEFAAGHAMWAEQVQTLWQVPSRLRDARSLQALRAAHELDPTSTRYAGALGLALARQGESRETRELLEGALAAAHDGSRLRSIEPLVWWADYLGNEGWKDDAEVAWRAVLVADPANCGAARELQQLLYARSQYDAPAKITDRHATCPSLHEAWVALQDENHEARLALARRDAQRYPLNASHQQKYVQLLRQSGSAEEAAKVLAQALAAMPDAAVLWAERADQLYGQGKEKEAIALLEAYRATHDNSAWLTWRLATMRGDVPLADLMVDGRERALEVVREGMDRSLSNDEAYYAIDFAARRFFPDGTKITLTHTLVRVMTKGAIDRYAEQNIPGNARVLRIRTIKQDGTVLVPSQTPGKSTLSMPGLAEGDFVELAYIDWDRAEDPPAHVEGMRFFFRMENISTLHSEYVVIGMTDEFMRVNDAPVPQKFDYHGERALRFLATNNPRPRSEPQTVSIEEYLPWIQMYRQGQTISDIESFRRDVGEAILDSSKTADAFDDFLAQSTAGEGPQKGSREWLERLFYRVASHIPDPSGGAGSFGTDVNHAILSKEGSSMLVLKAVLDHVGVENDVYLVKSKLHVPEVYPVNEHVKYGSTLLRVVVPKSGDVVWLAPDGPDAMFNAVDTDLLGQPAICATCEESRTTKVPTDGVETAAQSIAATGKLDADGTLRGTMTLQLEGPSAASVRSTLRSRPDETSRAKLADAIVSSEFAGATATAYRFEAEQSPSQPLRLVVDFELPNFAREAGPGVSRVETRIFAQPLASGYAPLPQRTTPLRVGSWEKSARLVIDIEGWKRAELASSAGDRRLDSAFGQYHRKTALSENQLVIESSIHVPIQRVATSDYPMFQKWALAVEQSSSLLLQLRK